MIIFNYSRISITLICIYLVIGIVSPLLIVKKRVLVKSVIPVFIFISRVIIIIIFINACPPTPYIIKRTYMLTRIFISYSNITILFFCNFFICYFTINIINTFCISLFIGLIFPCQNTTRAISITLVFFYNHYSIYYIWIIMLISIISYTWHKGISVFIDSDIIKVPVFYVSVSIYVFYHYMIIGIFAGIPFTKFNIFNALFLIKSVSYNCICKIVSIGVKIS